jgi:hypothetical protein
LACWWPDPAPSRPADILRPATQFSPGEFQRDGGARLLTGSAQVFIHFALSRSRAGAGSQQVIHQWRLVVFNIAQQLTTRRQLPSVKLIKPRKVWRWHRACARQPGD